MVCSKLYISEMCSYLSTSWQRTKLLHVQPLQDVQGIDEPHVVSSEDEKTVMPAIVEPHPDERQVRLDTDRSFVLYPVGEPSFHSPKLAWCAQSDVFTVGNMKERESRQNELHDLIVEIFRKRRKLSYFQVCIQAQC